MQISVMQQRVFTRTAILAVLVALATTQQCDYQVTDKSIISVSPSEKYGAVFMTDVYKSSREECQSACCDMEEEEIDDGSYVKCNLAVFHHAGKPRKANCFLIYCPSEGSCIFSELEGFSSSFVTETLKPTEVSNKPPSLKFTNPDTSPMVLHKLVRRSNVQGKSPPPDAIKDATDAEGTVKEKAGKDIIKMEGNLLSMVEQQIKKVESNVEAATMHETTPKSPEKITSSVSTTALVDGGKNKKKQEGAVVISVSTTKVSGDPTPKPTQAKAAADVETTIVSKEAQGSTGPPAATQPISTQAPHKTPSPPPPQDSPYPHPTPSFKPAAPSLPTNSTPPGSENHLTSNSSSGSGVEVEPPSSNTTHPPLTESSGSNVSQTTNVQPAKVSPHSPPTTQALKPSIIPTGSSSLSVSDSISNATHKSTLEAHLSSTLPSPSSSSNSPTTQSSLTATPPTHPTVPLNVTESSLQTPMSNVSNSTLPIVPSTAPPTAHSTAPSTPTSQSTLLHITSNQSHITPDGSLTTIEVTESTQSSTLYSDDDVNSPSIASKTTSSPKLTSPSNSTPSIPPTVLEPAKTIPSSVDDPFRKEMEDNQTLAGNLTTAALGGNETSEQLTNETLGVGNETAAAAQIDTVEGKEDTATNSLIASNGALIAAVCFGVLFLLAVLVVIGKHWYEAYQRRHYSKVDYLINGMYN